MSDATPPPLPALDNTMGVLYLSALLTMALWGAGTVQLAYYFTQFYRKDPFWLKMLVFTTWVADTAGQALISQLCYTYLITNYFNPAYLGVLQPTLLPIMFVTGITSGLAQLFFVSRIWFLSGQNIWVTGVPAICVAGSFVATIVFYGMTADFSQFAQLTPLFNFMHALNALSAASDLSVATVLIILLRKQRTGFKSTEYMINRLILFTLNTGLLCAACAVLTLIFNLAFPNTYIYMIFYIMVCRIYVNSLLACLNSRKEIFKTDTNENSLSESALHPSTAEFHVSGTHVSLPQFANNKERSISRSLAF